MVYQPTTEFIFFTMGTKIVPVSKMLLGLAKASKIQVYICRDTGKIVRRISDKDFGAWEFAAFADGCTPTWNKSSDCDDDYLNLLDYAPISFGRKMKA